MSRPVRNLRLFVAVYPPLEITETLEAHAARLDLPVHRPVPLEQIHLTLQFIGDTPVAAMDETIESVERAAGGLQAGRLQVRGLVSLPERGAGRLVAAVTDAPPVLRELKDRLVTRLARERTKKKRPFLPHLTLLRFRAPRPGPRIDEAIEDGPAFDLSVIRLMRSTLRPQGAEHVEVARIELHPARDKAP